VPNNAWLTTLADNLKKTGETAGLAFVMGNLGPLGQLGLDATTLILQLFVSGQQEAALVKITEAQTPEQMADANKADADDLNQAVFASDRFKADMEAVAIKLLPVVLQVAEAAATGGLSL
jgi:hypothetical protein